MKGVGANSTSMLLCGIMSVFTTHIWSDSGLQHMTGYWLNIYLPTPHSLIRQRRFSLPGGGRFMTGIYMCKWPCQQPWMQHVTTSQQSHAEGGFATPGDIFLAALQGISVVMQMKIYGQTDRNVWMCQNDLPMFSYNMYCYIVTWYPGGN